MAALIGSGLARVAPWLVPSLVAAGGTFVVVQADDALEGFDDGINTVGILAVAGLAVGAAVLLKKGK